VKPSSCRLEKAFQFLIEAVATRSDGETFLPVVLHLEKQIRDRESQDSDLARIKRLANDMRDRRDHQAEGH
jgi:hypothetical protein